MVMVFYICPHSSHERWGVADKNILHCPGGGLGKIFKKKIKIPIGPPTHKL